MTKKNIELARLHSRRVECWWENEEVKKEKFIEVRVNFRHEIAYLLNLEKYFFLIYKI
jgi:hypothetical protein